MKAIEHLEQQIERFGVSFVLLQFATICADKAHAAQTDNQPSAANQWRHLSRELSTLFATVRSI